MDRSLPYSHGFSSKIPKVFNIAVKKTRVTILLSCQINNWEGLGKSLLLSLDTTWSLQEERTCHFELTEQVLAFVCFSSCGIVICAISVSRKTCWGKLYYWEHGLLESSCFACCKISASEDFTFVHARFYLLHLPVKKTVEAFLLVTNALVFNCIFRRLATGADHHLIVALYSYPHTGRVVLPWSLPSACSSTWHCTAPFSTLVSSSCTGYVLEIWALFNRTG